MTTTEDDVDDFIQHEAVDNGWSEWVNPKHDGYKFGCCDCGLVHDMQFQVVLFVGAPGDDGLSEAIPVGDEDMQVIFRAKREDSVRLRVNPEALANVLETLENFDAIVEALQRRRAYYRPGVAAGG